MANKRQRPWQDEFERQRKTLVKEKMVNATDSNYMKQVYDKTNSLLFQGANKIYNGSNSNNGDYSKNPTSSLDLQNDDEMESSYDSDSSTSIPFASSCDSMVTHCGMEYQYEAVDKTKTKLIQGHNRSPSPYAEMKDFSFFNNRNRRNTISCLDKEYVINSYNKYRQVRLDSLWLQKSDNGPEKEDVVDPSLPNHLQIINPQIIPKDDDDVNME